MLWALPGCCIDSPQQYNVKNLDKCYFYFPATLFIAEIVQSHLRYLPTSLVLKLLYILSTSFLAYGSFVKVVQIFKSFPTVYSMTIFGKKLFNLMGLRVQNRHFCFSAVAGAVCSPTVATCVFFSSQYSVTKFKYSPVGQL